MKNDKILIVDDEARNQRILLEALEGLGEIVLVSSGEEALDVVETLMPDIILLDIMMPGIDGYEVCRKIRTNPHLLLTKIILVSGKAMTDERLQGYACGADDYITKPFVPEELVAKAKVFLRLSHVENEIIRLNSVLEDRVKNKTRQLMDAEEKMVTAATTSDITSPLNNIRIVNRHIAELVSGKSIDAELVVEKTKIIDKTLDRIGLIIEPEKKAV